MDIASVGSSPFTLVEQAAYPVAPAEGFKTCEVEGPKKTSTLPSSLGALKQEHPKLYELFTMGLALAMKRDQDHLQRAMERARKESER